MKRKIFAVMWAVVLAMICGIVGTAEESEIATYSDEYVSFDYIKGVNCDISYSYTDYDNILAYSCSTAMTDDDKNISVRISIRNIKDYETSNKIEAGEWKEHYFSESSDKHYIREVVSSGDFPEVKLTYTDPDDRIDYVKLIGYTENDFVVARFVFDGEDSEKSELCRKIYDSVKVTDFYLDNGYMNTDDRVVIERIYSNIVLSEQGKKYAEAAIGILEGYLSFEIDADEASKQIDEVRNRSESFSQTSDYLYDSRIDSELYVTSLDIDMGNDGNVSKTLQELKTLINEE